MALRFVKECMINYHLADGQSVVDFFDARRGAKGCHDALVKCTFLMVFHFETVQQGMHHLGVRMQVRSKWKAFQSSRAMGYK